MTLATKDGKLIVKDGKLAEDCGCCCSCKAFRAFDGSCKYYKYLTAYDQDLCSIDSVAPYFRNPVNGAYLSGIDSSWQDDGYFKLEAIGCGKGRVVEATRWYALSGDNEATGFFGDGRAPGTHNVGKIFSLSPYPSGSPIAGRDPATVRSLGGCGAELGSHFYMELSEEITSLSGLEGCDVGACCEGTTCSVKPQCQCQGAGQVFKGVGTTCSPNPCLCCTNGAVHPQSLIVEITGVSWVPGTYSLSFPLVGTYVVPFIGCLGYRDSFFTNSQPCGTAAYNCFAGCLKKVSIYVTTGISSFQILISLCDYDATDSGYRVSQGGEVWGNIPSLEQSLCGGQFPIEGTTTQRNNPNYGGVLNAISYRITKP